MSHSINKLYLPDEKVTFSQPASARQNYLVKKKRKKNKTFSLAKHFNTNFHQFLPPRRQLQNYFLQYNDKKISVCKPRFSKPQQTISTEKEICQCVQLLEQEHRVTFLRLFAASDDFIAKNKPTSKLREEFALALITSFIFIFYFYVVISIKKPFAGEQFGARSQPLIPAQTEQSVNG